jgi:hypothetical protein
LRSSVGLAEETAAQQTVVSRAMCLALRPGSLFWSGLHRHSFHRCRTGSGRSSYCHDFVRLEGGASSEALGYF